MKLSARLLLAASVLTAAVLGGCRKPNAANIQLRRQNAALRDEVETLKTARTGDAAAIRALESTSTTAPTLSQDRLAALFTTHGLKLGKLTGGADFDRAKDGDDGIEVFAVPTDQHGQVLKSAGSFIVEAFDLSQGSGEVRLGRWEFPTRQAALAWRGSALQYGYVLRCPWQNAPTRGELTLRVGFTDELTARTFNAQRLVKLTPPATTTKPATLR